LRSRRTDDKQARSTDARISRRKAMLCEKCGKREASVFYTDIQEGKLTQYHLCKECAEELGVSHSSSPSGEFAISNLLAGMLDETGPGEEELTEARCATCGLAYGEFKECGRLGCPDCYDSFASSLRHLLRRVHGSNLHEGKVPESEVEMVAEKREVRRLKELLQKAIDQEEFERAAEIRDQLKELEAGSAQPNEG
jgi:protein arginine kinase activator